jgi:hypothetical protein
MRSYNVTELQQLIASNRKEGQADIDFSNRLSAYCIDWLELLDWNFNVLTADMWAFGIVLLDFALLGLQYFNAILQ